MKRGNKNPPAGRARSPVLRFLLTFGVLLAAFYAVVLLPWCDRAFADYLRANAWLSNVILRALGLPTEVTGVTIHSANFSIAVRRGCDALEPAWFFCAAVLAFPVPWRRKPRALLLGTVALLALNLVRIVSLFLIGWRVPGFFAMAYLELWPAVFVLSAVGLWLAWIRSVPAGTARLPHGGD